MLCSMLCRIVVGPHSKIACLNVAFSLNAGPQQILTVTLKQKKTSKNIPDRQKCVGFQKSKKC